MIQRQFSLGELFWNNWKDTATSLSAIMTSFSRIIIPNVLLYFLCIGISSWCLSGPCLETENTENLEKYLTFLSQRSKCQLVESKIIHRKTDFSIYKNAEGEES